MKKILLLIALFIGIIGNAQWTHGVEFGGSNFTGLSLIGQYQFNLSKTTPIYVAPKIGVGHIFAWDFMMTVEGGFDVGYWFNEKHGIAVTTSASYLFNSPFTKSQGNGLSFNGSNQAGSYLWYSGLDYKLRKKKVVYSFGVGTISMISRFQNFGENGGTTYSLEDFIPMVKVGITF